MMNAPIVVFRLLVIYKKKKLKVQTVNTNKPILFRLLVIHHKRKPKMQINDQTDIRVIIRIV